MAVCYDCILQMYFTNVFYKCILQMYFTNVFYKCILQLYFMTVFYDCILWLYFMTVGCSQLGDGLLSSHWSGSQTDAASHDRKKFGRHKSPRRLVG
jgi:hypothetical protein